MAGLTSEKPKSLREILPDPPAGPLSDYRKNASFDWRTLKLAIEGEELIRYKVNFPTFIDCICRAFNAMKDLIVHCGDAI